MDAAARRIRPMALRSRRRTRRTAEFPDLEIEGFPVTGDVYVTDALLPKDSRHGLERCRLSMDDKRPPDRTAEPADPGAQLVPVGVSRITADVLCVGLPLVFLSQNMHDVLSALDSTSEGMLSLESDDEDEVPVIPDTVRQMMEDAP